MTNRSTHENEKPPPDSDASSKFSNETEHRSGIDRRKAFDRRCVVGRRRSSDRRRRKET